MTTLEGVVAAAANTVGADPKDLRWLTTGARLREWQPGEWLVHESTPYDWTGVIDDGDVYIVRGLHGDEHLLYTLGNGSMVSEGAVLGNTAHFASARTHRRAAVGDHPRDNGSRPRAEPAGLLPDRGTDRPATRRPRPAAIGYVIGCRRIAATAGAAHRTRPARRPRCSGPRVLRRADVARCGELRDLWSRTAPLPAFHQRVRRRMGAYACRQSCTAGSGQTRRRARDPSRLDRRPERLPGSTTPTPPRSRRAGAVEGNAAVPAVARRSPLAAAGSDSDGRR